MRIFRRFAFHARIRAIDEYEAEGIPSKIPNRNNRQLTAVKKQIREDAANFILRLSKPLFACYDSISIITRIYNRIYIIQLVFCTFNDYRSFIEIVKR